MNRLIGFRIYKGVDVIWDKRRGVPLTPSLRNTVFAARRVAESAVGVCPNMGKYVSTGKDGRRVTVVPSANGQDDTVRVIFGTGESRVRVDLILKEVGDGENQGA